MGRPLAFIQDTMPNELQQNEVYLSSVALQWITHISNGRTNLANRLLTHDCGLFGFDIEKHSTIYISASKIKKLPIMTTRRIFAATNAVVLSVELAGDSLTESIYQVYFRFQFAKISKVHFSRWDETSLSSLEQKWLQIDLDDVRFPAWPD